MKTFREFLLEGRGFEFQGSKYSSGFGKYTKNGKSISREEYMKASEAYRKKDGVSTTNKQNDEIDLTPSKIKSDEFETSEIKPIFSDIIPKEVVESAYSPVYWGDFLKDESKSFKLREYLTKLTGNKINADEFYRWSDTTEYEDSKIGAGGRTLVETIRKNVQREAFLDKELTELGIDPIDFKNRVNSAMKEYVKDGVVCVRCSPMILEKIIKEDGRFKTLFETKQSQGLSNIALRANVEAVGQGLSYKTKKKDRPIYGTLKHMVYDTMYSKDDEDILDLTGNDAAYGTMCVVLKKDNVRERTKISFGDSIVESTISSSLDEPNYVSLLSYLADGCKDLKEKYEQLKEDPYYAIDDCIGSIYARYAEVQISGGVTVDDIDHVVFRGLKSFVPKRCVETLNNAGIKFVHQEEF